MALALPRRRGAARPRVRAVPPDRDVARPRLPRPAAADLRGGPRRGRVPRRLARATASCRASHELADLAPARRGRQGDHPPDASRPGTRTCGSTPGTSARAFWERRFPTILATCRAHGVDPVTELIPVAPACHYASGGVAHRPVGPLRRPGPLRHRRGRLLRRARRQPARLQLAARGPGVLPPDRRGAARRAARRGPTPAADRRAAGLVDGDVPPRRCRR